jgi:hypothetical protein
MADWPEAVREYEKNPWGMAGSARDGVGYGGYVDFTPKVLADAAIAALKEQVARLTWERSDLIGQLVEERCTHDGQGQWDEGDRIVADLAARWDRENLPSNGR